MKMGGFFLTWIPRTGAFLSFLFSGIFFWIYYNRYFKWEFNELGRYYDPDEQLVYTSSGFVWTLPAVFFLLAGMGFLIFLIYREKGKS